MATGSNQHQYWLLSILALTACSPGFVVPNSPAPAPSNLTSPSTPRANSQPTIIEDEESPIASTVRCPNGTSSTRREVFDVEAISSADLKTLKLDNLKLSDHLLKMPIISLGEESDHFGNANTPFNRKTIIAFKANMKKLAPLLSDDLVTSVKLIFPKVTKFGHGRREFICVLENNACSGIEKSSVGFSQLFFNDPGLWKKVGRKYWRGIYEKKDIFIVNLNKLIKPSQLTSQGLTFIAGPNTYFEPSPGAKLELKVSYCWR